MPCGMHYTDYKGRTKEKIMAAYPDFSERLVEALLRLPRGTQIRAIYLCAEQKASTLADVSAMLDRWEVNYIPNVGRRTLADLAQMVHEEEEEWSREWMSVL